MKHDILYKNFKIKNLKVDPKTDILYLNEKLALHIEDLNYYKKKLQHFSILDNDGLISKSDVYLLELTVVSVYSSYKVTSLLYEKSSNKKAPVFENLLEFEPKINADEESAQ